MRLFLAARVPARGASIGRTSDERVALRYAPLVTKNAAALVIGNELLTGKVADENISYLARSLFDVGVSLQRVVICPDVLETIAHDVNALRAAHDWLFTSGGVGPTHDDITIDAVAHAFGRPLVRSTAVESLIRGHYGERTTEEHLRMANMPDGAELVHNARVPWPTVKVENVLILPGIPEIFRAKVEALKELVRADRPFVSRAVYTWCDEGSIASLLEKLTHHHPDIAIGSYPRWNHADYRVKLTFDGTNAESVEAALNAFCEAIPAEKIVRRD